MALVKLFAVWAVLCAVVHILVLKARLFYWIVPLGQLQQQLLCVRGSAGVHLRLGLCVCVCMSMAARSLPGAHCNEVQVKIQGMPMYRWPVCYSCFNEDKDKLSVYDHALISINRTHSIMTPEASTHPCAPSVSACKSCGASTLLEPREHCCWSVAQQSCQR